jgi:hypothetical protein
MIELLAENNFGDTRSGSLAGPTGLVIILLLGIGTVLLIRNMNSRLKRLPERFEEPPAHPPANSPATNSPAANSPASSSPASSSPAATSSTPAATPAGGLASGAESVPDQRDPS